MRKALLGFLGASGLVALGLPVACEGCGSPTERVAADASAGHAPVDAGLDADADASDGGPVIAGACGPIGPWGPWPPEDAPPRAPVVLAPRFERPDCGPGCRLVTTRWNGSGSQLPYEMRFSGNLMTQMPIDQFTTAVATNLDTTEEYESPGQRAESGATTYSAALSGACLVQDYSHVDDASTRGYVCETCLYREARRGLWYAEGTPEVPSLTGVMTASDLFVLLGGGIDDEGNGRGLWALDLRDGSTHKFAPSIWLVTNVSLNEPYIVLSHGDGEVHIIDTRDWSDTNVTNDPALQYMAASDGTTIVRRRAPTPTPVISHLRPVI